LLLQLGIGNALLAALDGDFAAPAFAQVAVNEIGCGVKFLGQIQHGVGGIRHAVAS